MAAISSLVSGERPVLAHVCPWWGGFFIDNPLRRLLHVPERILGPYLRPGMTAMDVGCGMGWFSIPMAKMVGDRGRVVAVDLQPRMLDILQKRAEKAGLADRIQTHLCERNGLGVDAVADFALAFAMVHEVPDPRRLLSEIHGCLKPGGKLLVAEPRLHVSGSAFAQTVGAAEGVGLCVVERPRVRWCRAAVLEKV
jgi:2-polyprenyl-3-methyl-5-hydroxy-6-metoxy-1,4-benzoquinol methylase